MYLASTSQLHFQDRVLNYICRHKESFLIQNLYAVWGSLTAVWGVEHINLCMIGYRICPVCCTKNVFISLQSLFLKNINKSMINYQKSVDCWKIIIWKTLQGIPIPTEDLSALRSMNSPGGNWCWAKVWFDQTKTTLRQLFKTPLMKKCTWRVYVQKFVFESNEIWIWKLFKLHKFTVS